ncbi:MAG: hypothetical protein LBQ40_07505 [Clostridiales bacterium]|jgi:hypothetical protein|nr:hypothetical protein [Clostridiales bacterium]
MKNKVCFINVINDKNDFRYAAAPPLLAGYVFDGTGDPRYDDDCVPQAAEPALADGAGGKKSKKKSL